MKKNSAQFKGMGLAIAAMGTAALVVFKKMVKQYVEVGDMVHKMAIRTGFAAETLSELAYAADISGADLSMLEKGVKKMSKTIVDASYGLETYLRVFRSLGLEIEDLMKLTPEEQFLKIGAAIADMENQTLKTAAAVDVFGRAGTMLLPLFAEGAEGIAKLREEAHRLGIIFDEEAAAKAAKLKDAQTALTGSVQGLSIAILNDLIPVITEVTKGFTDWFVKSREGAGDWTQAILGFFRIIGKGIQALMLAWHGLQVVIFKGAEFVVKAIKFQIDALTAPLRLLAKLPGYGALAKKMLKAVAKHTADLTTISEGYNETAGEQIERIENIVASFESFFIMLEKVSGGLKTSKEDMKGLGDVIGESALPAVRALGDVFEDMVGTALPAARDLSDIFENVVTEMESNVETVTEIWEDGFYKILGWAHYFVGQLSGIFSQLSENQMANIENEYEARRAAIENSLMSEQRRADAIERLDTEFEKRRKKAARTAAARTKAIGIIESIIHTASAITEALPDLTLAAAVAILGAIQTTLIAAQPLPSFQRGGRIEEAGIVGEAGPELFVPGRPGEIFPIRERARALGARVMLAFNPTFYLSTLDPQTARDVVRDQIGPEMLEMFKTKILLPEFQTALGIR